MSVFPKTLPTKATKSALAKFTGFAGGMLPGLIIGVLGLTFLQGYNPPDESKTLSPSTVFERVVEQNEMASVSQNYCLVDKASDSNSFFELFDILFTGNSFWYRYAGTLKAGVNMKDAGYDLDGQLVTISLSRPYIVSNALDFSKTGVLEERNNVLDPIHIDDVDAFQRACDELGRSEAVKGGLLAEARQSAEKNISGMFAAAFGNEYEIRVVWREG